MKRWQDYKSYFWEEAPFFRLLIPLVLAILWYDAGVVTIDKKGFLFICGSIAVLLLLTSVIKLRSQIATIARFSFIQIALFLAGLSICGINDIKNEEQWFGNSLKDAQAYSVRITEAPREREKTWKVRVTAEHTISDDKADKATGDAYVFIYKNGERPNLNIGDVLLLPNKWTRIKNPGNPFEFDYARFCARNNLYYQQFIRGSDISILKRNVGNGSLARSVHDWGMEAVGRFITDRAAAGLMQAMLLGDEVNFDSELRQAYSETGIVHIVAISGSHVAAFFFVTAGLFFWVNKKYQYLKYLFAIPLIWFYVLVAGMPSSAVRAAVMFSIGGFGFLLQRQQNPLNILFATAFLMLIANPMWLFAIGFQLSFVAVLSLMIFYRPVYKFIHVPNLLLRKIWQTAAASIAAEVLVAPLIVYYFHLLPATFLVANVIAYLFMGVSLVVGMLLIMFGKIIAIGKGLGLLLGLMVQALNEVVYALQGLNPPSFEHLYLTLPELIVLYIIIACFALFFLRKVRAGLLTGLGAVALLLALLVLDQIRANTQQQFAAYNVGGDNYTEIIAGNKFHPVCADSIKNLKRRDYATREMHIASRAWKKGGTIHSNVLNIGDKSILILEKPISQLKAPLPAFDYVVVNSPLEKFDFASVKGIFGQSEVIVGSNQKRYVAERWKDSCAKYRMPVHFTQLDGAIIVTH